MARKTAYYATKIAKSGLARGIARGFARGFPGGPLVCNLFFAQSLSINKKKCLAPLMYLMLVVPFLTYLFFTTIVLLLRLNLHNCNVLGRECVLFPFSFCFLEAET